jgi:excisionase family DNA binding protein
VSVLTAAPTTWDDVPIMASIDQASAVVGVSRSTFYALLKSGEIRAKRVGRRRFVPKVELRRYCEGGK